MIFLTIVLDMLFKVRNGTSADLYEAWREKRRLDRIMRIYKVNMFQVYLEMFRRFGIKVINLDEFRCFQNIKTYFAIFSII